MSINSDFVITQDGTPTLWDSQVGEHHHSLIGAYTEARYKFVEIALPIIKSKSRVSLLDLPFGLGYNLIAILKTIDDLALNCFVDCVAIEKDLEVIRKIAQLVEDKSIWSQCNIGNELIQYFEKISFFSNGIQNISADSFQAKLLIDDLLIVLPKLESNSFDLIFYDPFSPRVSPSLWSKDNVLVHLERILNKGGMLITYTASNKVRKGLLEVGLSIAPGNAVGRKMPGTIASKAKHQDIIFNSNYISQETFTKETWEKINRSISY